MSKNGDKYLNGFKYSRKEPSINDSGTIKGIIIKVIIVFKIVNQLFAVLTLLKIIDAL